jgi:hypothetical protein
VYVKLKVDLLVLCPFLFGPAALPQFAKPASSALAALSAPSSQTEFDLAAPISTIVMDPGLIVVGADHRPQREGSSRSHGRNAYKISERRNSINLAR